MRIDSDGTHLPSAIDMSKRAYKRRSEDEKIAELNAKIEELKRRVELRQRKDGPVFKELNKLRRALVRFSQTAMECERADLSMMTQAFLAGLERSAGTMEAEEPRRRGRPPQNPLVSIA
jgi:hypothetical protein